MMFGNGNNFGAPNFGGNSGFNSNPFGQNNLNQPPHMQQLMPSTGGIQPVLDQNGIHYEQRIGNIRYDVTDPTSMDYIVNETPNVRTVIDEHGNIRYEQENGWLRWNW